MSQKLCQKGHEKIQLNILSHLRIHSFLSTSVLFFLLLEISQILLLFSVNLVAGLSPSSSSKELLAKSTFKASLTAQEFARTISFFFLLGSYFFKIHLLLIYLMIEGVIAVALE